MKKIALVLLIGIITITAGFAQKHEPLVDFLSSGKPQYYTQRRYAKALLPESVKVIGVYTISIALNAVGDGLDDSGHKEWGHLCNAASIGLLVTSPFIIDYDKSKWGWYLTSYLCLRVAAFDYTYNATRGLPLNYIGVVSTWDKVLKKLNPPNTYLGRAVFFTVGVSIPINKLKKHTVTVDPTFTVNPTFIEIVK